MPDTFQALAVLIVALLPGALYVWSFERYAGAWGVRFADRAVRFVGVSAVLQAAFVPLTFATWHGVIRFFATGRGRLPGVYWLAAIAYVGLPLVGGALVGVGSRDRRRWATFFTGPNPEPRAWDHLFSGRPRGWVRLRMKSGVWLAGAFTQSWRGLHSYAAGYPEEQDLFLAEAVEVDPETGEFNLQEGGPVARQSAILVRWSEVEYLEFTEA